MKLRNEKFTHSRQLYNVWLQAFMQVDDKKRQAEAAAEQALRDKRLKVEGPLQHSFAEVSPGNMFLASTCAPLPVILGLSFFVMP